MFVLKFQGGKLTERIIKVSILFLLLCTSLIVPCLVFADAAIYFYDDVGQLVKVATGTVGLVYQYDEVGNLLSITKGTIGTGSPILNSITPNVLFIGSTTLVSIQGQKLFTTRNVTSDSPFLSIKILNITETEIRTEITVSSDAYPYADTDVNINVTTGYDSASIKARLIASELAFSPELLILTPGSSDTMLASIWPSIGKDVTIILNNSNPSVASVPQSVTIPSSGTTSFNVTALNTGVSYIDAGTPEAVVYVTTDTFPSLPGKEIIAMTDPVSVYIEKPSSSNTTIASLPVSVYIETPSSTNTTASSLPVSVYIETQSSASTTASSAPVSVYIETPSSVNTTAFSSPVSVKIEGSTPSQGNTTVTTSPVSVYIETPSSANTTVSSLPVSVYIETPLSASVTASSVPVSVYIETPSSTSATAASMPVSVYIETPSSISATFISLPVSIKINQP
jgi:hypothetical protein